MDPASVVYWITLAFIIWYFYQKNKAESEKEETNHGVTPPGPKPTDSESGNLEDLRKTGSIHQYLSEVHEKYGPIVSITLGKEMMVSIASAELFKQHQRYFDRPRSIFDGCRYLIGNDSIQLKNGDEGQSVRKALAGPFKPSECLKYNDSFVKSVPQMLSLWRSDLANDWAGFQNLREVLVTPAVEEKGKGAGALSTKACYLEEVGKYLVEKIAMLPPGTHVPVRECLVYASLKAFLLTAFGFQVADDDDQFLRKLNDNYDKAWLKLENSFGTCNVEHKSMEDDSASDLAALEFRKSIKELLESRQKNRPLFNEAETELFVDVLMAQGWSEEMELDNAVTYFIAGFHTTGYLMTWLLYFITKHSEVQEKVVQELKEVFCESEQILPENISQLKYLHQVIDETLRLSVLGPYAARYSSKDVYLGGYLVPADTPVFHALGVVMKDQQYWPNPDLFDPDRFSPENVKSRPTLAFSPFGFAGKRICPGYRFAYVEAAIVLAVLLLRFKWNLVDGQDIRPIYGLVTKPNAEIWMTAENRI